MKITDFGRGSPDETGGADDALWLNNLAQDSGHGYQLSVQPKCDYQLAAFLTAW